MGSLSMVSTLSDAYRRRDATIGADDVLVSIVRRAPTAREFARRLTDELNGGGSSGSPVWSPGLVESRSRDHRLSFETSAVLRESAWNARRDYDTASRWSVEVWDAVFRALRDARSVGVTFAHVGHLLPALLAEKGNGAHQLLSRADIKAIRCCTRPGPVRTCAMTAIRRRGLWPTSCSWGSFAPGEDPRRAPA